MWGVLGYVILTVAAVREAARGALGPAMTWVLLLFPAGWVAAGLGSYDPGGPMRAILPFLLSLAAGAVAVGLVGWLVTAGAGLL